MLATTLSVTALFVAVAATMGLWSPLSQRWLRENGFVLLDLGKSPTDDALAMMVSLNELQQPEILQSSDSDGLSPESKSNPMKPLHSAPFQNALAPAPIIAASHTSVRINDDIPLPAPPEGSSIFARGTQQRLNESVATINDVPGASPPEQSNNPKLIAKPVEFKRSQSKPPVIVPVEQAVNSTVVLNAEQSDNDDLKRLPLERLFPLLGSTQERRVRLVCDELSQRGIPNSLLELSVQLARGEEAMQLELLDRLARTSETNPAPILGWMAQSSSKAVRKRAIAILGSLQDREVVQQLRFLATREPDSSLRQLIEQTVASNFGAIN